MQSCFAFGSETKQNDKEQLNLVLSIGENSVFLQEHPKYIGNILTLELKEPTIIAQSQRSQLPQPQYASPQGNPYQAPQYITLPSEAGRMFGAWAAGLGTTLLGSLVLSLLLIPILGDAPSNGNIILAGVLALGLLPLSTAGGIVWVGSGSDVYEGSFGWAYLGSMLAYLGVALIGSAALGDAPSNAGMAALYITNMLLMPAGGTIAYASTRKPKSNQLGQYDKNQEENFPLWSQEDNLLPKVRWIASTTVFSW